MAISQSASGFGLEENYRMFQVIEGNLLVPTNETMNIQSLNENLSKMPTPPGFKYQFRLNSSGAGTVDITDPNGKTKSASYRNFSAFAPHPVDPQVYAVVTDNQVVIVRTQ